jgi:ABC-2 type transport system permease protein
MLNRVLSLTRVLLVSSFRGTRFNAKKNGKSSISSYLLYGFLVIYMGGMVGYLSYNLIKVLLPTRQASLFVGMLITANIFMTLFMDLLSAPTVLYFGSDLKNLLPLPFKPKEVLLSKYLHMLCSNYIGDFLLLLLPLTIYGVMAKAGILFFIFAIFVYILLPIVPVFLTAIIIILLFSFLKLTKYKTLFQVLTYVLIIAMAYVIGGLSGSTVDETELLGMLMRNQPLVTLFSRYFPTIGMATDALVGKTLLIRLTGLGLLFVTSIAIAFVMVIIGEKFYYKGAVGALFTSEGVKKGKVSVNDYKSKGVALNYILKEFRSIFRSGVCITQLVLPSMIMPIILAFSGFMIFKQADISIADVREIFAANKGIFDYFIYIIGLGVFFFTSMYCYVGMTSVSRDGSSSLMMKTYPVSSGTQLIYKAVPDMVFTFVPPAVVILLTSILFGFPLMPVINIFVTAILYSIFHGLLFILFDANKPRIQWTTEYELFKNNFRILIVTGISAIFLGLHIFMIFRSIDLTPFIILYDVFFIVLIALLLFYYRKNESKLLKNLH